MLGIHQLKPVKETNAKIEALGFALTDAVTAKEFMRRPKCLIRWFNPIGPAGRVDEKTIELIGDSEIKYEGYISKALDQVEQR